MLQNDSSRLCIVLNASQISRLAHHTPGAIGPPYTSAEGPGVASKTGGHERNCDECMIEGPIDDGMTTVAASAKIGWR